LPGQRAASEYATPVVAARGHNGGTSAPTPTRSLIRGDVTQVPSRFHNSLRALGFRRQWLHNGAMPSVQIKDVPEETHAVLRRRAAAARQSLQEYLLAKLVEEASRPTLDEVLDRAGGRSGGSVPLKAAARTLRAERARR